MPYVIFSNFTLKYLTKAGYETEKIDVKELLFFVLYYLAVFWKVSEFWGFEQK